jgi:exodeoxyribonuclease VII large subunit
MSEIFNNQYQAEILGDNRPILSVSELSQTLKRIVEENFSHVRVRGEISRFTLARSGHMYMTLKDEGSVLDAVCWKRTVSQLSVIPEDGVEVIITGRLTTYSGRSNYQIVVEKMEIAGEGALLKLLEDRRKKFLEEGLFDEGYKKPLPYLPSCIGVVTSPTGAVIRDILHRLSDRFPRRVLLFPANVQGVGAAEQIATGIETFNQIKIGGVVPQPDLIIVARGGGSFEDLWTFNEEVVVRAAAKSKIPLISAVGHETDTTLIDFAADKRAPTPSAAAEMAVPVLADLLEVVQDYEARLQRSIVRSIEDHSREISGLSRGLPNPLNLAEEASQKLDERSERLFNAKEICIANMTSNVDRLAVGLISPAHQILAKKAELSGYVDAWQRGLLNLIEKKSYDLDRQNIKLEGASYQRVLDRGFALVTHGQNQSVLSESSVVIGMKIDVKFFDGDIAATVINRGQKKPQKKLLNKNSSNSNGKV